METDKLNELIPVYGAFGIFSHYETKGVNIIKKLLPAIIVLSVLKSAWGLLKLQRGILG
jgi:hypothetical protein